jgi:hypothetical protein
MRRVVERGGGVPEIARLAGVSTQSVYGWLAGSKPYRDRVTRIALALGISEHWLWTGEGTENDDGEVRLREEPPTGAQSHAWSSLDDNEIAERLGAMVRAFGEVPPAFGMEALASINQTFAEFRRRAEARVARASLTGKRNGK